MTRTVYVDADGLGIADWIVPLITSVGGAVGGAIATRAILGRPSPSQKEVEKQIRLQQELEIQRMLEQQRIQSQQTQELGGYLLPAVGILALVMLMR